MENIKSFLESSTIHGLGHISTTRRCFRIFWILIVVCAFTGAGYFICQSFGAWAESPVKTAIETLPIEDMPYPKITVCPPKKTFTDLNYDLILIGNKTIENKVDTTNRCEALKEVMSLNYV